MRVYLNGKSVELPESGRLESLLEAYGFGLDGIALALNGQVLSRLQWDETLLGEGDRIEVVRAVGGG
mgnify:CR=1 FL=1